MMAYQGNTTALRLCMERTMPVRRQPRVRFKLPRIKTIDDVAAALETVISGVTQAELTLDDGQAFTAMLESLRRVIESQVQRDAVDVTNRPVPVIMIPAIVPRKDDEMQEIPHDARNRHGQSQR